MSAAVITTPTPADVLRGALTELRRPLNEDGNGWTQGQFGDFGRCKCAIGAINVASGSIASSGQLVLKGSTAAREALRDAVAPRLREDWLPGEAIIIWNDATGRTFAEVEMAFERAIELAEAGAR
jgi:hypothetical protein